VKKLLLMAVSTFLFASSHASHWGYTGESGPEHWGDLNHNFVMCKEGKNQAPINIRKTYETNLEKLNVNYKGVSKNIVNNGHTVQVNIKNGSYLRLDGKKFDLLQFHFHTPSENNINSKSFPMEAHFVHSTKNGELAVIALMFKEGRKNYNFEKIVKNLPTDYNHKHNFHLNITKLLPKNLDYYRFNGSLTTPPCTEGVRWIVLKTPVEISKKQIKEFHHILHNNNRPIQPVNSRIIVK